MADASLTDIYIMGEHHRVPDSLTILQAFEYAGYKLVRGVGCRGGFCGACATVYRLPGDYHLKFALACQTRIEPGMQLAMVPFFPAHRSRYRLSELKGEAGEVLDLYPELLRCFGCNTCTKSCPQDIDVLGYVAAMVRGDLSAAADISFDCIMCGLCVSRCPAELVKHNAALLARRLCGRRLATKSEHLIRRCREIEASAFAQAMRESKQLSVDEMKRQYAARDIEPGE
ncbi:4Fe-4S dicluster domain-containing protein [candidate division WOR-3 bacterium]|nr:4Fe-4S dicluster domain-containing protein [candidate division WOR-3 bacterium]